MSASAPADGVDGIRDDLAFMRGLIDPGDSFLRTFGRVYFMAGVCYVSQITLNLAQSLGWLPAGWPWLNLAIGFGPTVVFLAGLGAAVAAGRLRLPVSQLGRTTGAVFQAIGLTNVALAPVIGVVAWREHSFATWLIFPCVVFVCQGAGWQVLFAMRREPWILAVAAAWVLGAIGMALSTGSLIAYVAVAGVTMALGMAAPGAYLMTRKPA